MRAWLLGVLALCWVSTPALARRGDSQRATQRWGASIALLEPFPCLLGLNAGWNATSYLRLQLGAGRQNFGQSHLSTWALGVRFFVPHWNLSPFIGASYAAVAHTGPDTVEGFNSSGSHGYGSLGLEWHTESGFTAGVGYQVSTRGSTLSRPSLSVGWYVEI